MPLEDKIDALKASIDALTAALKSGKGAASTPAATTAAATGKAAGAAKPKKTVTDVAEAAAKVKSEISKDAAVHLITTVGKAPKLAEIKPANYDAFVAACEAAIEAGEVEGMDAPAEDEM